MSKRKKAVVDPADTPRAEAVGLLRRLLDDGELRDAVESLLTEAGTKSKGKSRSKPSKDGGKKKGHARQVALLIPLAGIGALAASAPLRSKELDTLFGAEEEFEYTPPADGAPPTV
jgi:hypothetical protein